MININDIADAFSTTVVSSRVSLDGAFKNENGEKANTVHSILKELPPHLNLDAILLHSDGGVNDFYIIFSIGDYPVILGRFQWDSEWPFNSPDEFAQWLNNQVKKFEATVVLNYL